MSDHTRNEVPLNTAIEAVRTVLFETRAQEQQIAADTTLEELGITSLDLAEIIAELQRRLGAELVVDDAANVDCVGDLVHIRRRLI